MKINHTLINFYSDLILLIENKQYEKVKWCSHQQLLTEIQEKLLWLLASFKRTYFNLSSCLVGT